jgi:hypothetical protein
MNAQRKHTLRVIFYIAIILIVVALYASSIKTIPSRIDESGGSYENPTRTTERETTLD